MKISISLLLILIILISCDKVKEKIVPVKKPENFILAGQINNNTDTLVKLSPRIKLHDSCNYSPDFSGYQDQDSIDLFHKGHYDIRFKNSRSQSVEVNNSFCPRSFSIELLSHVQIGYKHKDMDVGLPLRRNDTISKKLNWVPDKKQFLFVGPPGSGSQWLNDTACYLAFRRIQDQDTLYGWIKIDSLSVIREFGINK